jgi:hypothetical protein
MVRVEGVATQEFTALVSMPLLTELVSAKDGFCYRHGAPNGAVPKPNSAESSEEPIPGTESAAIHAFGTAAGFLR